MNETKKTKINFKYLRFVIFAIAGFIVLGGLIVVAAPPKQNRLIKVKVKDDRGINVTIIKDYTTNTAVDLSKGIYIPEINQTVEIGFDGVLKAATNTPLQ